MNSDKFIDVIKKKVILEIRRLFSDDRGIFQQDLVPCHSSK